MLHNRSGVSDECWGKSNSYGPPSYGNQRLSQYRLFALFDLKCDFLQLKGYTVFRSSLLVNDGSRKFARCVYSLDWWQG